MKNFFLKTLCLLLGLVIFVPQFVNAATTADVITLLNQDRASVNLPALTVDSKLTAAAQAKAQDMVSKNYFAHTSPDGSFYDVFITNAGYMYSTSGENLYQGNESAATIISDWKNSELHRQNMESSEFTQIGIGMSGGYVVAMFGASQDGLVVPTPTPKPTPAPKLLQMPKKVTKAPVKAKPVPKPKPTPTPKAKAPVTKKTK